MLDFYDGLGLGAHDRISVAVKSRRITFHYDYFDLIQLLVLTFSLTLFPPLPSVSWLPPFRAFSFLLCYSKQAGAWTVLICSSVMIVLCTRHAIRKAMG